MALHLEMTTGFQSARKVDYKRLIITTVLLFTCQHLPRALLLEEAEIHKMRPQKVSVLGSSATNQEPSQCLWPNPWTKLPSLPGGWDDNYYDPEEGPPGPRFWNLEKVPVLRL